MSRLVKYTKSEEDNGPFKVLSEYQGWLWLGHVGGGVADSFIDKAEDYEEYRPTPAAGDIWVDPPTSGTSNSYRVIGVEGDHYWCIDSQVTFPHGSRIWSTQTRVYSRALPEEYLVFQGRASDA